MPLQWLIDLIIERIGPTGGYVNRGDPGSADFTVGDFTRDGSWHTLDLSSIVPEGVNAVNIRLTIKSTISNKTFSIRTKGNVNAANIFQSTTQTPVSFFAQMGLVFLNDSREIEYHIQSSDINQIFMVINGWWL